jgi:hypothetical protein
MRQPATWEWGVSRVARGEGAPGVERADACVGSQRLSLPRAPNGLIAVTKTPKPKRAERLRSEHRKTTSGNLRSTATRPLGAARGSAFKVGSLNRSAL